ncbi:MAG: SagB/ThcOx family dehydrogenase [Candidatus Riflebacteria bacterium]|nr:SagB/ThcOx family dehydrogenase [Candidatus Riflebacteria bacterium]
MNGCGNSLQSTSTYTILATIQLPPPQLTGNISLEATLAERRSLRQYGEKPPGINEISQLLWAAQGITGKNYPFRTAPSAGATYPLETYLMAGNVTGLESGVYHYDIASHSLKLIKRGDHRAALCNASVGQKHVKEAPITIILTAIFQRTTNRYGSRGIKYTYMEAGHVGQNICLQAEALDMGSVPVGAIDEDQIATILGISRAETPLYIFPVGYKR